MSGSMNQMNQSQRLERINIHELQEKASSKREVYNFLTLECEAYLPKPDTVNIFFLKQIMKATKDVSSIHLTCAVHKAICCQGSSCALDWWLGMWRSATLCKRQAKHHATPARRRWMESLWQKVDLRCDLHNRCTRNDRHNQQSSREAQGQVGAILEHDRRDASWVCSCTQKINQL